MKCNASCNTYIMCSCLGPWIGDVKWVVTKSVRIGILPININTHQIKYSQVSRHLKYEELRQNFFSSKRTNCKQIKSTFILHKIDFLELICILAPGSLVPATHVKFTCIYNMHIRLGLRKYILVHE